MRDVLVQRWICEWYSSILLKSKWDVWSSLLGWEMCEKVWRTAMGLERRWLQAVTTAVAICLLSKYADAHMDPSHTFTMHLLISFLILSFYSFSQLQAFLSTELSSPKLLVVLLMIKMLFKKLLTNPLFRKCIHIIKTLKTFYKKE